MYGGSSNLLSVLVLLAITFAASSGTDISYIITELNTKLTYLQQRLDLFDYITEGNVSVLVHRVELNELKCVEKVPLQIDATNDKPNTLEGKLNALATTVTNFVADIKETLFKPFSNCIDVFERPLLNRGSGVYNIQLNGNTQSFDVYCMADPMGGLPWTIVQRRVDGSTNFNRNWDEYKRGFGDLGRNLFIGLEKLHLLTTQGEPQELWVKLIDPKGVAKDAYYDRFAIGSEAEEYPLSVLGNYSGNAGDALKFHKDMKFSTFDNDNDVVGRNCAAEFKGAWWFSWCFICHLNGIYGSTEYGRGVNWYRDDIRNVTMQYAHMAIRPVRK